MSSAERVLSHEPGSCTAATAPSDLTPPIMHGIRTPLGMGMGDINEMYEGIVGVVEENAKLKEMLRKTNEMMQMDYQTLAAYRTQVETAQTLNTKKIQEAKAVVNKLQDSNSDLQAKVEQMCIENEELEREKKELQEAKRADGIDRVHDHAGEVVQAGAKTGVENQQSTDDLGIGDLKLSVAEVPLEQNELALREQVNQEIMWAKGRKKAETKRAGNVSNAMPLEPEVWQASAVKRTSRQCSGDSPHSKVDAADYLTGNWSDVNHSPTSANEVFGLPADVSQNDLNMPHLLAYEQLDPCHLANSHVNESMRTMDKMKTDSQKSETDQVSHQNQMTLKSQVMTLIRDVYGLQKVITDKDTEHVGELKSLHTIINMTEKELREERQRCQKESDKQRLQDEKFHHIYSSYRSVVEERDGLKTAQSQSREDKQTVNELMAKLLGAEDKVRVDTQRIHGLQNDLRREKERNDLLIAQGDVYKEDFASEVEARRKTNFDKKILEEQLSLLQIQHQELLDEHERFSINQLQEMQQRHTRSASTRRSVGSTSAGSTHPPPSAMLNNALYSSQVVNQSSREMEADQWLCPKCGQESPDVDSLQIHVIECLDGGPGGDRRLVSFQTRRYV